MIVSPEKGVLNTHNEDLRFPYHLRMGLSTLMANKLRQEITDTLSNICICGSRAESTMHFLALLSHIRRSEGKVDETSSTISK